MKKSKQFKSKGLRKQSDLIKNRGRYLLLLPAIVFIVVFAYLPMVGMLIAFENYDPVQGIFGSRYDCRTCHSNSVKRVVQQDLRKIVADFYDFA